MNKNVVKFSQKSNLFPLPPREPFWVKISPGAKQTRFLGVLSDGSWKISLQAPPEKGKANKALIRFLHEYFGGEWKILTGTTNERKKIQQL